MKRDRTEWRDLASQADIDALMRAAWGFHDGCFREAHVWTETYIDKGGLTCPGHLDTHVRAFFQLAGESLSAVELRFDEVMRLELLPSPENCDSIIAGAGLHESNGIFQFHVRLIRLPLTFQPNSVVSTAGREADPPDMLIVSRHVRWRDASTWRGNALRYAAGD